MSGSDSFCNVFFINFTTFFPKAALYFDWHKSIPAFFHLLCESKNSCLNNCLMQGQSSQLELCRRVFTACHQADCPQNHREYAGGQNNSKNHKDVNQLCQHLSFWFQPSLIPGYPSQAHIFITRLTKSKFWMAQLTTNFCYKCFMCPVKPVQTPHIGPPLC